MALQFVLGSSGVGKSYTVYKQMIEEAVQNPKDNYILLVPEQFSLALQRKMVLLHPNTGTMNIDVIGFNRLAYRLFDEQNIKIGPVLEDFGKTMLVRQVAEQVKDELSVYSNCLDKPGFIDEVKSLMSEMYQYDVDKDRLGDVLTQLKEEQSETLLYNKLHDMQLIFNAFDERIQDSYIVAEQRTELMADAIPKSKLISNSTIVMDGFTGFTPIQRKVVRALLAYAKDVRIIVTIEEKSYYAKKLPEHNLFYLSKQTINYMLEDADASKTVLKEPIFIGKSEQGRFEEKALLHLEENLFRYPYRIFTDEQKAVQIISYDNPLQEITGIAQTIHTLVKEEGYRYRDIAIISGNLENTINYVDRVFPLYSLPYFLDYSRPVQNNPCIDALEHLLTMCVDGFTYDSMFAFLKSGVIDNITNDQIELFENYALSTGIHGHSWWNKEIDNQDIEQIRVQVMNIVNPFYESITGDSVTISTCVAAVYRLFEVLGFEEKLSAIKNMYACICEILDKMLEIMAEDIVTIDTFEELLLLGLSDLALGMIPNSLDSVIVGDITRTRLDDIRVLFVIGVNDGVIPKKGTPAQIISDYEKERLETYSLSLAPTEKMNAYIEQFYLYTNMTKPKNKLFLSYVLMNGNNEPMRPSYVIGRINKLFPKLKIVEGSKFMNTVSTKDASIQVLIFGLQAILQGDTSRLEQTLALYKLYLESEDESLVSRVEAAIMYNNIPEPLTEEVAKLVRVRLLSQSVSSLERYANCAYAYFLQYALGIKERGVKQIDNRNIGIILHAALESMFRHVHDNLKNDWYGISDDDRASMTERFVKEAFACEYSEQMDDPRYVKLLDNLIRIGKRTTEYLTKIGNRDVLLPEYFEYKFQNQISLPDVGETMQLRGVVDRGDVYYDAEQQKLRLRIVDYKSGNHDFKLHELYEGLQLQLAIYMGVMEQLVSEQYRKDGMADVQIVPDSMLYYQFKDPYVEADDAEKAQKERNKKLDVTGLKSADVEYFHNILRFAEKKMKDIATSMLEGRIDKAPMVRGKDSACTYCAYADVCRFDDKFGNNHYRYMKYKQSEEALVYAKIQEELGGTGV